MAAKTVDEAAKKSAILAHLRAGHGLKSLFARNGKARAFISAGNLETLRASDPTFADEMRRIQANNGVFPQKSRRQDSRSMIIALLHAGVSVDDMIKGHNDLPGVSYSMMKHWRKKDPEFDRTVGRMLADRSTAEPPMSRARALEVVELIVPSLKDGRSIQSLIRENTLKINTMGSLKKRWPDLHAVVQKAIARYATDYVKTVQRRDGWRDSQSGLMTDDAQARLVQDIEGGLNLSNRSALADGGHPGDKTLASLRARSHSLDAAIRSAVALRDRMARNRRVMFGDRRAPTTISTRSESATSEQILSETNRAVPATYPRHIRDDIIGAVVLMVIEGRITFREIRAEASRQATAYWRGRPEYRFKSLDAPAFSDGKATMHDFVSTNLWDVSGTE